MPRDLDSTLIAAIQAGLLQPAWLVQATFVSGSIAAWGGIGTLTYDAVSYLGVGSLLKISAISEGSTVKADGASVSLSGIDPTMLDYCLAEIQLGAAASIYFGALSAGALVGPPYLIFAGTVDKPTINVGPDSIMITLALENKLSNLQRPRMQRYTAADQQLLYPHDIGFNWDEILNDIALRWGS